jgi:hypothetical protein
MTSSFKLPDHALPPKRETELFLQHRKTFLGGLRALSDPLFEHPTIAPGGVGQGCMIKDAESRFSNSTGIYFYIIAPRTLGGHPADLLYLTSSSRVAKGCEALISYQEDGEAVFRIWDWSAPKNPDNSQWVVSKALSDVEDYELTYSLGGNDHTALYVVNLTRWVNDAFGSEVFLHNKVT